jgi:uncharacterized protein (TIGR01244 family)
MRQIARFVWVSPQPSPSELSGLAAAGVRRLINNRPDGEEPGQPSSSEMEAAAREAGLDYLWIPIQGLPGADQVEAVGEALEDEVPTLLFCRSGTRSAAAWALGRSQRGDAPEAIREAAAKAGYDFSRLPL